MGEISTDTPKEHKDELGSTPVLWNPMRWGEQASEETNGSQAALKNAYEMPELKGRWTEKFVVEENVKLVELIVRKPTLLLNKSLHSSDRSPIIPGFVREEPPKVKEEPSHNIHSSSCSETLG